MIVRWATPEDHEAVCTLLLEMHAEIGQFKLSKLKLAAHVSEILATGRCVIAEIDGNVVGSIGLQGSEPWYSEQTIISDSWIFVSAKVENRLPVFRAMVAGAKQYAQDVHLPLVLALYSPKEKDRKDKLFQRYGEKIMEGFQFTDVGGEYRVHQ